MEIINSLDNKKIKLFASLKTKKYRDRYQLFIVQEKHLIHEAIANNCLDTLIVREGVKNIFEVEPIYVSDKIMTKLSENVSLNDYIGICKISKKEIIGKRIIVLETVQDPGNIGTIIRTAYSLGYDGIYLSNDCCDLYNEKTIQASQGAIFYLPVVRKDIKEILLELKEKHYQIIATALKNSVDLHGFKADEKFALVMGNEGNGISEFVQKNSDAIVKIEMNNFESLNVAVAASICMYYFNHQ